MHGHTTDHHSDATSPLMGPCKSISDEIADLEAEIADYQRRLKNGETEFAKAIKDDQAQIVQLSRDLKECLKRADQQRQQQLEQL